MRIIVIGGVVAGMAAAVKARRNDESAEIVIYEKQSLVSYTSGGMPYHIGGEVAEASELIPLSPSAFEDAYDVKVRVRHEVLAFDAQRKTLMIREPETGDILGDRYDKLILATGATADAPRVPGAELEHVFTLRTLEDMNAIKRFVESKRPQKVVIVGTGPLGLEMCENLKAQRLSVTLVERIPQIAPGLDDDMAAHVDNHLRQYSIGIRVGCALARIQEDSVTLTDGRKLAAHMVLLATGVKPNTALAATAGVLLGESGAIQVNAQMQTNLPDVYACGDCAEYSHALTGKPAYRPLGSTALKTGRVAGDQATGGSLAFSGVLGTGIFRLFDMTVAQTGLTQWEAEEEGYDLAICHTIMPNRPEYMGGRDLILKAIADKHTGRLLGAQIVGYEGVDKRIDVLAAALSLKARAADLAQLELAYSSPFSTPRDPVMEAGMTLDNIVQRRAFLITPDELDLLAHSGEPYTLVDLRSEFLFAREHIPNAVHIAAEELRDKVAILNPNDIIVLYCHRGDVSHRIQSAMLGMGYLSVYNLSGGMRQYQATHSVVRHPSRQLQPSSPLLPK